jgi:hydroxymethylbilane synthase
MIKLTIVSRKSKLALTQANIVKEKIIQIHPEVNIEIIGISTSGDEILDQPLNKIGGKGLFVNELENYLLLQKADIAVHSMKDVPAKLADGLAIGAILKRADHRDVFVSQKFSTLNELPPGSIIGTSSLRRQAQVLMVRKDLEIKPLRGNVDTRLRKMLNGEYAAIILAAAGLQRLGLTEWLKCPFAIDQMLPAVGQGAIGIEYNAANKKLKSILDQLHDDETAACVTAERAMNAKLDGGCQAPIAGFANVNNSTITLRGLVAHPDGATTYTAEHTGVINSAHDIGLNVAEKLLAVGAGKIISELKDTWHASW